MSIVLLVYLASIVNSIKSASGFFFIIFTILYGVFLVTAVMYNSEQTQEKYKIKITHIKKTIAAIFFIGCVSILTPSEKAIYLMAAASIAYDIANSPKTAATLDKVYKIVDKKLDEQLSDGIDKQVKKIEEKIDK